METEGKSLDEAGLLDQAEDPESNKENRPPEPDNVLRDDEPAGEPSPSETTAGAAAEPDMDTQNEEGGEKGRH